MSQKVNFLTTQKVSIVMSQCHKIRVLLYCMQRLSFVMSQKRSIFMAQKMNFMSQKLSQFVTNSEF